MTSNKSIKNKNCLTFQIQIKKWIISEPKNQINNNPKEKQTN